jgi:hypothetical protein
MFPNTVARWGQIACFSPFFAGIVEAGTLEHVHDMITSRSWHPVRPRLEAPP